MALLFMDSFDHYATADLMEKWSSMAGAVVISAGTGRRGSASGRITSASTNALVKGLPASGGTGILGFGFVVSNLASRRIAGLFDAGAVRDQVYLQVNIDGSVAVYRGVSSSTTPGGNIAGVLLGAPSAGGVIAAGVSAYIEFKVTLHDTTGAATVRVNGTTVLALTNQDTANGSAAWTSMWLGASPTGALPASADFDDLYVLDGTGPAPWNDFLGDCRVDPRYPTAAGATTGWTPSAGANWSCVDEPAPNDDTDYTSAAAAGLTDTFVVQDAPVPGAAIYGIQHCLSAKKTDAGAASMAPVIRHGSVDYVGIDINPSTAYTVLTQIAATNPGTAAAWTESGFNAAEFGYKRTV